jgi:HSP20 family protein
MKEQLTAAQPAKGGPPVKLSMDDFSERVRATYDAIARRAYEIFETHGHYGNELNDWFKAESELLQPARLELLDSGDAFIVRAEVPGFQGNDLEVKVETRRLIITGRRETKDRSEPGKTIYTERRSAEILRVLDLAADVDPAKVTATLKDGILELNLPKALSAKKTKVKENVA